MKKLLTKTLLLMMMAACAGILVKNMLPDSIYAVKNVIADDSENDTPSEWNLILVNKDHPVPQNYEIEFTDLSNGERVDSRIYPDLQNMFDDARNQGINLYVREGYRTKEEQQAIMDSRIQSYKDQGYSSTEAKELAEEYVAAPGTSEHQLGICVDINTDPQFGSSDALYTWLNENAYKYGFVKRYSADKVELTGISDEPWHYRYVGKTAAKEMKEKNLCLEEYVEKY